ncbi:unnamed protein product, partial [Ectocarpus sp. 8 AP-2014]
PRRRGRRRRVGGGGRETGQGEAALLPERAAGQRQRVRADIFRGDRGGGVRGRVGLVPGLQLRQRLRRGEHQPRRQPVPIPSGRAHRDVGHPGGRRGRWWIRRDGGFRGGVPVVER